MIRHDAISDRIMIGIFYVMLVLALVVTLYPFWEVMVLSVSPRSEALQPGFHIYTFKPSFTAYLQVVNSSEIWRGFLNSGIRVLTGTVLSVFLTALTAYPLSKKTMPFNKTLTSVILFTMLFNGGLIPNYLLMKSLKLIDTLAVLIVPTAVTAYNLIIMRNFLRSIPDSLEESAKIDGASDFSIWYRIILPLSKPVLATVALWVAVSHWNAYFDALIYINDRSKYVLQIILRRILLESQLEMYLPGQAGNIASTDKPVEDTVKSAIIMVSTVPIMIIYPFLQKYFVKGIMLGSVKG